MESAAGDCLMCSDIEETAVRSACQKFCRKVQASCRLARQTLWKVFQMVLNDINHQAVWGSNFIIVKEE